MDIHIIKEYNGNQDFLEKKVEIIKAKLKRKRCIDETLRDEKVDMEFKDVALNFVSAKRSCGEEVHNKKKSLPLRGDASDPSGYSNEIINENKLSLAQTSSNQKGHRFSSVFP